MISSSMELKVGRWTALVDVDRSLVWIWIWMVGRLVVALVGWMKQEQVVPLQQVFAMVVTVLELMLQLLVQYADVNAYLGVDRRKMVWSFPFKVFEIMVFDSLRLKDFVVYCTHLV